MQFFLKKASDFSASPASEFDVEKFTKVTVGHLIKCEYVKSRNYRNLQRYHVLIAILWENMDIDMQNRFVTKDRFRKALEYLAGYVDRLPRKDGTYIEIVGSIAFDVIKSEHEFQMVFSKVIDAALEYFPTWTRADMRNAVENEILNFS